MPVRRPREVLGPDNGGKSLDQRLGEELALRDDTRQCTPTSTAGSGRQSPNQTPRKSFEAVEADREFGVQLDDALSVS